MARTTSRQKRRRQTRDELKRAMADEYGLKHIDIADSAPLGDQYLAVLSRVARTLRLKLDSFNGLGPNSTINQAVNVLMAG